MLCIFGGLLSARGTIRDSWVMGRVSLLVAYLQLTAGLTLLPIAWPNFTVTAALAFHRLVSSIDVAGAECVADLPFSARYAISVAAFALLAASLGLITIAAARSALLGPGLDHSQRSKWAAISMVAARLLVLLFLYSVPSLARLLVNAVTCFDSPAVLHADPTTSCTSATYFALLVTSSALGSSLALGFGVLWYSVRHHRRFPSFQKTWRTLDVIRFYVIEGLTCGLNVRSHELLMLTRRVVLISLSAATVAWGTVHQSVIVSATTCALSGLTALYNKRVSPYLLPEMNTLALRWIELPHSVGALLCLVAAWINDAESLVVIACSAAGLAATGVSTFVVLWATVARIFKVRKHLPTMEARIKVVKAHALANRFKHVHEAAASARQEALLAAIVAWFSMSNFEHDETLGPEDLAARRRTFAEVVGRVKSTEVDCRDSVSSAAKTARGHCDMLAASPSDARVLQSSMITAVGTVHEMAQLLELACDRLDASAIITAKKALDEVVQQYASALFRRCEHLKRDSLETRRRLFHELQEEGEGPSQPHWEALAKEVNGLVTSTEAAIHAVLQTIPSPTSPIQMYAVDQIRNVLHSHARQLREQWSSYRWVKLERTAAQQHIYVELTTTFSAQVATWVCPHCNSQNPSTEQHCGHCWGL